MLDIKANRTAAAGRIRALLAKTVANGCTEQEAIAAASKAGELMDRYALTFSDVEIKQERCERRYATDRSHDVELVSNAIARFCGCKAWKESRRLQYFGMAIDVEAAAFLTDLCWAAMEQEFRAYLRLLKRRRIDGRTMRKSFMVAMAGRLSDRLTSMAKAREATAQTSTGTSLVVVRNAVVEEQLGQLGMSFRTIRRSAFNYQSDAYKAGQAAADAVNLTTGIRG